MPDASGLAPDAELGKYRLIGLLGRGGMGEVWAAHDPDLDRKVALKVLRPSTGDADVARARLLREGRAMARLRHPNVITVYEATTAGGRDIVAMELVEGDSLASWLATRREPAAIVAALLAAGRGLAAAHAGGMVHRDFKPHNVLVDRDGRVLVTDFGLARNLDEPTSGTSPPPSGLRPPPSGLRPAPSGLSPSALRPPDSGALDETVPVSDDTLTHTPSSGRPAARTGPTPEAPLTKTGSLLGTPAYMAPEQLDGRPADARSDQFAFCVTAWEALAGARPFPGSSFHELRDAVLAGVPTGRERVPRRLRPILTRGLAVDPATRWPTMDALLRALERAWRRPRRIAIGAAIAAVVAGGTTAVVLTRGGDAGSIGPCPSPDEAFASVERNHDATELASLEAAGPAGKRALAFFMKWRADWRATYIKTCQRAGDREFAARRSCLEGVRDELAGFQQLGAASKTVDISAIDPVTVIAPPSACFDHPLATSPAPPATAEARATAARIRAEVVNVRVHGFRMPREQVLEELDRLVREARALGHPATLVDALLARGDVVHPFDPAGGWTAYEEALRLADESGADRQRSLVLFGMIEAAQRDPARTDQIDELLARAQSNVDALGDPAYATIVLAQRAVVEGRRGDWDGAIEKLQRVRETWKALDAPILGSRAALQEIELRRKRHQGDDLTRAEAIARESLDALPPGRDRERIRLGLAELLFTAGRLDEAVTLLDSFPQPALTGDPVGVRVLGEDGQPVGGAELISAVAPTGDPLRLARAELQSMARVLTDKDGRATVPAPRGALLLARKGDAVAVVPAPPPGAPPASLRLGPTAPLVVRVTSAPIGSPGDPRAARREPPLGAVVLRVGEAVWSRAAPVNARGEWRLADLVPGRYLATVEVESALGDVAVAWTTVQLAADRRERAAPVELVVPAVRAARVIVRPATEGILIAVPGTRVPTRWKDAMALVGPSGVMTYAEVPPPRTRADGAIRVGDAALVMSIPAGPTTLCALPGAVSPTNVPLPVLVPGPDATPPACVAVSAGPTSEPVPTVTITPR